MIGGRLLAPVAMGLALVAALLGWRLDAVSRDLQDARDAARRNAEELQRQQQQNRTTAAALGRLRQRFDALNGATARIEDKLRHEADGPAAPVLRCAVSGLCDTPGLPGTPGDPAP